MNTLNKMENCKDSTRLRCIYARFSSKIYIFMTNFFPFKVVITQKNHYINVFFSLIYRKGIKRFIPCEAFLSFSK